LYIRLVIYPEASKTVYGVYKCYFSPTQKWPTMRITNISMWSPHLHIKQQFCRSGQDAGHDVGRKLKSTSVRWTLLYSVLNATPLIGSYGCRETLNTHSCTNQQPHLRYITWNKIKHLVRLSQATILLSSLKIILRSYITQEGITAYTMHNKQRSVIKLMLFRTINHTVQAFITLWNKAFPSTYWYRCIFRFISRRMTTLSTSWPSACVSSPRFCFIAETIWHQHVEEFRRYTLRLAQLLSVTNLHATWTYFQAAHRFCTPLCSLYISLPFTRLLQKRSPFMFIIPPAYHKLHLLCSNKLKYMHQR